MIMKSLRKHPLVDSLLSLKGNQRSCVYPEPLWGIPYNLYAPFASIFMISLGVTDGQIGIILSVGMVFQVIASLLGGVLTDKMGRNKTTLIFDIVSWSIPCLIWAFSQNFWWFFIANIFNSMWQITNNSWNCLLVEDCDPKQLVPIYTWCTISGLLVVFFAPIASLLVNKFSVVPTVRALYIFSFIMMTIKFLIVWFTSKETTQGKIRMEETKNLSIASMLLGYKDVFFKILKSPQTMLILVLMVLTNVTSMISDTFFPIYVTQSLGIPNHIVGYFPMVRATIMLIFIFLLQTKVSRFSFKPVMFVGFLVYILAIVLLLFAPKEGYGILIFYIFAEAIAHALIVPRKESLLVLFVDPQERARMVGLLYVIMIGLASPFGVIIGQLSEMNRRYPFFLSLTLFASMAVVILIARPLKKIEHH